MMVSETLPGGSPILVAAASSSRRAIQFSATTAVMLNHGDVDAGPTTGFPLAAGQGPLIVSAELARQRWTAYSAAAGMVGVLEYYGVWP